MRSIRANKNGFTLIELIVAIAILGIITAIAFPTLRNIQEKNSKKIPTICKLIFLYLLYNFLMSLLLH